jgi:hypothetical protein
MHAIVNNQKSIFIDKTQSANNDPFLRREGKKKSFYSIAFFFSFYLFLLLKSMNERLVLTRTSGRCKRLLTLF